MRLLGGVIDRRSLWLYLLMIVILGRSWADFSIRRWRMDEFRRLGWRMEDSGDRGAVGQAGKTPNVDAEISELPESDPASSRMDATSSASPNTDYTKPISPSPVSSTITAEGHRSKLDSAVRRFSRSSIDGWTDYKSDHYDEEEDKITGASGTDRKPRKPRVHHRIRHSLPENDRLTDSLQLRREQACQGQRLWLRCPAHTQLVIESTFFGRSVPYSELCPPRTSPSSSSAGHQDRSDDENGKGSEEEQQSSTMWPMQRLNAHHESVRFGQLQMQHPQHHQQQSSTSVMGGDLWQEQYEDLSCDVTNAHSKVMEICQYRRKCKINANSRFFGRDPCPTTSKYLQITYKCKPSRFGSETFCEGSRMELNCKTNQRLAIYSATYGRTVASNPIECSGNEPPVSYDCTVDVLQKLIQICHAQSKCSMDVEDSELGAPGCPDGTKKYLNVIFICVSEEVFSDNALTGHLGSEEGSYEYPPIRGLSTEDPMVHLSPTTLSTQNDASADFGTAHHPRSFIPASDPSVGGGASVPSSSASNPNRSSSAIGEQQGTPEGMAASGSTPSLCLPESVPNAVIQVQNWLSTYEYIHRNQEKFFLYFGLSASTGIIALLLFCIVQLCWRHRGRSSREAHTNEFGDKYTASRASSKLEVASAHTPTVFDEGRVEMTDFGREGISFLRFNHPTPPRNSNNHHTINQLPSTAIPNTSTAISHGAVSVAVAPASSFPSHQYYS